MATRLPRLLDKNLQEVKRLHPRTQSIELNITPLSTASMTLDDESGVSVRDFVELYTAKGSAGIYRVTRPETSYGGGERISLEHGICVLDDAVVRKSGTVKGTPHEVFDEILKYQRARANSAYMWTLGTVDAPDSETIEIDCDYTKTLEMLIRVVEALDGYMLTFDQSVYPWVVNVKKKPSGYKCEGRLSRNIRTIRYTEDDSDLCTRLRCSLLDDDPNDAYMDSDTTDTWGIVEQSITLNDDTPKDKVTAYCRRYLNNRKNPRISVELDADEWYAMTGEALDKFEIGDICRLALPKYGITVEERIVSLTYQNALSQPEAVMVSLANQTTDMSIKLARTESETSSLQSTSTAHGNSIRTSETNITNLKDQAEGFKTIQDKMVHWYSSVEIDLDATEEGAQFGALASYKQVYDLTSGIDYRITEAELILHGDGTSANAGLVARVQENEEEISSAALTLYGDGTSANAGLVAQVGENSASIKVQASELESRVTIDALEIELRGYVTADRLRTEFANFESGISESLYVSALSAKTFECSSFSLGGTGLGLSSATFLTDNTSLSITSTGGTVTGVTLNKRTSTIYYMSWE